MYFLIQPSDTCSICFSCGVSRMAGSFLSINDMVAQARRPRAARLRRSGGALPQRAAADPGGRRRCGPVARRWSQQNGWRMGFVERQVRQDEEAQVQRAAGSIAGADLRPAVSPPKRRTAAVGSRGGPLRCGEGDPAMGFAVPGWEAGRRSGADGKTAPWESSECGRGSRAPRAKREWEASLGRIADGRARSVKGRDKERFI